MRQIEVTAAVFIALVPPLLAASNPNCWGEPRVYHPAGEYAQELKDSAAKHVRLRRAAAALRGDRVLSPNGAYAFHRSDEPRAEGASGTTSTTVAIFTESQDLLELQAIDVWNVVDVKWLNEKLVSLRVWLSRIGGVDVVVDVEQDKLVITDAVADGRLLWEQAQAACRTDPKLTPCEEPCIGLK